MLLGVSKTPVYRVYIGI
jgi:hypothetical protein